MTIRAVLFDIGGPLDTEVTRERLIDEHIRAACAEVGHPADGATFAEAARWAVESFAPDTYRAIIWRLCGQDAACAMRAYAVVTARAPERQIFEPREGMLELLAHLHRRELLLGLAANAPHASIGLLDAWGAGDYFQHREVAGTHGLRKPDLRLFLRACADLGVEPGACIMVGDRVDNDVAPAKLLGMSAILFRTGRHREQQPRCWDEAPDAVVYDVAGLEYALWRLIDASQAS